jgi:hypothetical protein
MFIQEHWLPDKQLSDLNQMNTQLLSNAAYGFDNIDVSLGRPYGGDAILWRSDIRARIKPVAFVLSVCVLTRRVACL